MKLALRWTAAAFAFALIAWLWFDSAPPVGVPATLGAQAASPTATPEPELGAMIVAPDEPAGEEPASQREVVAATESSSPPADAKAPPEFATLIVRVISKETREPLVAHRVTAFPEGEPSEWKGRPGRGSRAVVGESAATDTRGFAELVVPVGAGHRVATLDMWGAAPEARTPPLTKDATYEVELAIPSEPDLLMFVRVVDALTGAPLPGATVSLDKPQGPAFAADADGVLVVEVRSWISKTLRVSALGRLSAEVNLATGHATRANAFEISLHEPAALEVLVVDEKGPVHFCAVELEAVDPPPWRLTRSAGRSWPVEWTWQDRPPSGAVASFAELPAGLELRVAAEHAGRRRENPDLVVLAPGQQHRIEVQLHAGAQIRGRVVDASGAPIAAASITCDRADPTAQRSASIQLDLSLNELQTDADGRFVVTGLTPGLWELNARPRPTRSARGLARAPEVVIESSVVEIRDESEVVDVRMVATAGKWIEGRVLDVKGEPISTAVRTLNSEGSRDASTFSSTKDGAFRLGPLVSGEHTLVAFGLPGRGATSTTFGVLAGASDVVLQLGPSGVLRVLVHSAGGDLADAQVTFARSDGGFGPTVDTAGGVAELANAALGSYVILVESRDGGQSAVGSGVVLEPDSATAPIELVLRASARLALSATTNSAEVRVYQLRVNGATLRHITFRARAPQVVVTPAGLVELRRVLALDEPSESYSMQLAPGETRELILDRP